MCDSTRQSTDRLHLARHSQLPLQNALLGYVFDEHFEINRLPIATGDSTTTAQYRDGCTVLSFPFRFDIFEIIYAVQQLEKPAIFHSRSENLQFKIGFQKLSGVVVSEYLL